MLVHNKLKTISNKKYIYIYSKTWMVMGCGPLVVGGLKAKEWEIKKGNEKRKREVAEKRSWRLQGRKNFTILRLAAWVAKQALFCMKFWERILLDARNVSTVVDFIFNGLICRYVVRKLNPKTLIKCFFLEKKIIHLVVRS